MDEFNEETNEAHDTETDGGGDSNLLKFTTIWFCAPFHQTNGIFGKQTSWFAEFDNLIHFLRLIVGWSVNEKKEHNTFSDGGKGKMNGENPIKSHFN